MSSAGKENLHMRTHLLVSNSRNNC